jgi:hypothetical protein
MQQPKRFAFVLMPFDSAFDDIYKLGIKEAVSQFDEMVAERVDEQMYREGILERIYRQIEIADIVIADMTGQNPNVFYEVGYAHAKGKLCILLTSDAADIPFDLKHRRHIVYNKSITTLRRELIKDLDWAREELEKQRTSHIHVTQQTLDGLLTKTKYAASGEVTFKIDLENTSNDRAVNIQSLYFYSRNAWTLYQDDRECPSTTPDAELVNAGWQKRHFLQPPLPWLQKGAWAQVKFMARRTLANVFKGDEIKAAYQIRGRSFLRVVTPEGNFDYEIPVDVTVEDVPF